MSAKTSWDDEFTGLGGELLLGRKRRKPALAKRGKSLWTGVAVRSVAAAEYPGRGSKADVAARLKAIANKRAQVVVKIPAKGRKTTKSLPEHFKYLARDGEETLRDQDGREFSTKDDLKDLYWAWKHTGPGLSEDSPRKEAFHIIFSMREGTDEAAVFGAVKATAENEFAGHQWVMVQHHDEPQVHVHLCVRTESLDGLRLNPRKADLQRWRERFAYELRERRVEAEATRRAPRLQREKDNKPWGVAQMEQRGEATNPAPAKPDPGKAEGWRQVEAQVSDYYDQIVEVLSTSNDLGERQLAAQVDVARLAKLERNRETDLDRPARDRSLELDR